MPNLRATIFEHINNPSYHPVKPAVIAKKLGLSGEATQELKKTIKRMVKAGELAWGPSHLVCPASKPQQHSSSSPSGSGRGEGALNAAAVKKAEAAAHRAAQPKQDKSKKPPHDPSHFTGTFRRAAGGFGFVRPEGTQRAE